jgi:hypothetical protein
MANRFTEYQYLIRCVKYIKCNKPVTVDQFLHQFYIYTIVYILIKDNNIFLIEEIDQI